jgi:hypothetical protein
MVSSASKYVRKVRCGVAWLSVRVIPQKCSTRTAAAKYNFNTWSGPRAVSAFGVITKQELLNWLMANSLKAIKLGCVAKQ